MNDKNILLVSDEKYLIHGEIFLKSLFLYNKKYKVHYFIITNNKQLLLNKIFYEDGVSLYFRKPLGKNEKQKKAYYANSRVVFCKELFNNTKIKHLMYVDVDSIIKKNIDNLYKSFFKKKCILQIKKRKTNKIKNKFMTGIFLIKNNKKFINLWLKNLKKIKFLWFGDQISIYKTSKDISVKSLILDLPFEYIDFRLDEKSAIWSGRSGSKNYYKYKFEFFLIKYLYKNYKLKEYIDNFFLKKILYKLLDLYDKKFTKKLSFLFNQD